jgi:hypothetical protein
MSRERSQEDIEIIRAGYDALNRGDHDGAEVDQRFAYLYTLGEGDRKIVRCQLFPTVEAAMDSAKASQSATRDGL